MAMTAEAVAERRPLRPPHPSVQALEQRMMFELGALMAASPVLRAIGRGDRHPVLVLPGFMGDDASTMALRAHVRSWGYWAHGSRFGTNLGPTARRLAAMEERLVAVHDRHGRRLSLVGWSAGGLYARHLARKHPDKVRQVVTMGSPLQLRKGDRTTASPLVDRLEHLFDPDFFGVPDHEKGTLPVPSTAIYTKTDGVVRWQTCIDIVDDTHENVEVHASHVGLGFNPFALAVIADRLRQPEDSWRPFRPPRWLRPAFPKPVSWTPNP